MAETSVKHLRFLAENYGDSEDAAEFAAAADAIERLAAERDAALESLSHVRTWLARAMATAERVAP